MLSYRGIRQALRIAQTAPGELYENSCVDRQTAHGGEEVAEKSTAERKARRGLPQAPQDGVGEEGGQDKKSPISHLRTWEIKGLSHPLNSYAPYDPPQPSSFSLPRVSAEWAKTKNERPSAMGEGSPKPTPASCGDCELFEIRYHWIGCKRTGERIRDMRICPLHPARALQEAENPGGDWGDKPATSL